MQANPPSYPANPYGDIPPPPPISSSQMNIHELRVDAIMRHDRFSGDDRDLQQMTMTQRKNTQELQKRLHIKKYSEDEEYRKAVQKYYIEVQIARFIPLLNQELKKAALQLQLRNEYDPDYNEFLSTYPSSFLMQLETLRKPICSTKCCTFNYRGRKCSQAQIICLVGSLFTVGWLWIAMDRGCICCSTEATRDKLLEIYEKYNEGLLKKSKMTN